MQVDNIGFHVTKFYKVLGLELRLDNTRIARVLGTGNYEGAVKV